MEAFLSITKGIFSTLIRAGTIELDGDTVKNYEELDVNQRRQRDGVIDGLFGNYFAQQLTEFEDLLLTKGFSNHIHDLELRHLEDPLQTQYYAIRRRLNEIQLKYEFFTRNPSKDTWDLFQMSFPMDDMANLYKWITEESLTRPSLVTSLLDICSLKEFKIWQQDICVTFARAVSLQIAYIYHSVFRPFSDTTGNLIFLSVLPAGVKKKLELMEDRVENLTRFLSDKLHQLKFSFLFKKGTDPAYRQNDWEKTDGCFELASKVYAMLTEDDSLDNDDRAEFVAGALRAGYPGLRWSVVVMNGQGNAEFQLNPRYSSHVWMQKIGTRKTAVVEIPVLDNVILSRGLGGYGVFLCYQVEEPLVEKAALVFWADPLLIQSADLMKQCGSLMERWEKDRMKFDLTKKGSVCGVAGWVRENDADSVFGVGLRVKSDEEMGLDFSGDKNHTFPLCLGDATGCVLMWPELAVVPASLKCEVTHENLGLISLGDGIRAKVYKGRRKPSLSAAKEILAVKSMPLTNQLVSSESAEENEIINLTPEQAKEVALLDDTFRDLQILKAFCHPNVVRIFDCRSNISPSGLDRPVYQIVMELCAGGSLSERVKKPVKLIDIFTWTEHVLKGLSYLHGLNIIHGDIQGDHLLFKGPSSAAGDLKMISLGRIDAILPRTDPSEDQIQQKKSFQPKKSNGAVNQKVDIFSVGCVLIQMITGSAPVWHRESDDRPVIPDDIPYQLRELIVRCLDASECDRPCAPALFDKLTFDHPTYESETWQWTCPTRKSSSANTSPNGDLC